MSARPCPYCGVPVADGFLDEGCQIRLENNLTDLAELNGELHTALTRMVRMSERSEHGKSFEKPLVFNATAAETIRLIRSTLVSWVRELSDDTGTPLPRRATIRTLVEWLLPLVPEVVRHRADSSVLYDEIKHLRDTAQNVVDLPINRTVYEVGPCPEDLEDGPCPGKVWAVIPRDEEKRPRMECRSCKMHWYAEQWHNVGARIIQRKGEARRRDPASVQRLLDAIFGTAHCA